MWVEQPYASQFRQGDRIAVKYDQTQELLVGKFLKMEGTESGYMVYFVRDDNDDELSASNHRKFFRWEEDVEPEDTEYEPGIKWASVSGQAGPAFQQVDESRLRLNQPDPMAAEVEAAEAHLLKRIERLEQQLKHVVQVGKQTYVLNEGDHLRVWWEDGNLYTEFIQEVQK